ncbi:MULTISPECIES: penicillin acylase family protein [Streptomyces]|uniref:Acyl-homoserine-lactone acylase n=1 Tax=Streptomyces stelliscabiei TaxID=146820 RepID=A0A8I0NWG2_9ACTN|nr:MULTISPECIES: penicillin acylase family protein [Streptomyces]KND43246.1 penicillin amidase [Streptomyces stelliscabiei]MBE1594853.1 acyl-homoserine-lactone acylase [Streptomyces stelliscabiei]MDX2519132.1 penicillin acylase family protein [Streptomyces stelliscabiei]SOD82011.1 acyl-homoserine-lactone acylase [Streptomyces sp. 1222.2]
MRTRLRRSVVSAVALLTASAVLPSATAADDARTGERRTSHGGLSAVIRYTEYGVPHIVAKDYANLGFGTGWAQAADQVCVLADGFVTVRGERSRHFGPDAAPDFSLSSASKNLTSDLYFRGVRDAGTVQRLLDRPEPLGPSRAAKDLMRGWAAGYNAWLKKNRITDPACEGAAWVRPVSTLDVFSRAYALAVLGGEGRLVDAITTAQPPAPGTTNRATAPEPAAAARAARELFDAADADMGSNAVAFRGDTTANGRGLLLGNPHYPWVGGRRFWQAQQTIPGELNVSGGSLLGTPITQIGFNAKVAWSHTVATGVPMNVHQLALDPADPTTYLVDGAAERMTKRTVTVGVKDGSPVTRTQWWTRYGPVVTSLGADLPLPWTGGTAYALNDPNTANIRFTDTSLGFAKARGTADVLASLARHQGLPWVNTVAADSAGHTLFTQSQTLPRITDDLAARCSTPLGRATYPSAGVAILDGSRADCALGSDADAVQPGIFGPARMPTLKDAPYAENSNDSAWLANADQPLTGYERVFGNLGTQRSMRTRGAIEDVAAMADEGGLTVRDLQRQQFANRVPAADLGARDAARACAALPDGTATTGDGQAVDVSEACRVLRAWNRTADSDSRGALLFDRFWRRLNAVVPRAQLWKVPFSASDPVGTPNTLNTDAPGFGTALAETVTELRAAGIPLDAKLGDHQFVVRDGRRIPVSGGTESLGVWNKIESSWRPAEGGYPEVSSGSSHIQAVGWDGGRCPVARTLLTYSQSSNPNSPHHLDQTRLFSAEKWVTSRFCEKDILSSPKLKVVRVGQ